MHNITTEFTYHKTDCIATELLCYKKQNKKHIKKNT